MVVKVSPWCLDTPTISNGEKVFELDYSPSMQYIVVGLETKTRVYHAGNKSLVCTYAHGGLAFGCIKFFPSNDKFAFGIQGDSLRIVSATNCTVLNTFPTGHTLVHGVNFNALGTKMLTCGEDQKFKVWDITTSVILTSTPPLIGGNFNVGQKVKSC